MDPALGVSGWQIVLLAVIALLGGIGITSIGPGGIFVTIGLYLITPIPHGTVAGTASATFIATGLLGGVVYWRSGELATEESRWLSLLLCGAGLIGALAGVWLNGILSEELFGVFLGAFVTLVGTTVGFRDRLERVGRIDIEATEPTGAIALIIIGFGVGVSGGMLGVGGPVLAVPLLVVIGFPMLVSLAVAQVQSIVIAAVATTGYFALDAVSVPLAILVGVPELIGVVIGWKMARSVNSEYLKVALGTVLLLVGPYIALG